MVPDSKTWKIGMLRILLKRAGPWLENRQHLYPWHFKGKYNNEWSFPGGPDSKESACSVEDLSSILFNTLQCILLGESHGHRRLVGYSPWGCKESGTTERLSLFTHENIRLLEAGVTSYFSMLPSQHSTQPKQEMKRSLVTTVDRGVAFLGHLWSCMKFINVDSSGKPFQLCLG